MKNLFVASALACALLEVSALAKDRNWQTGKVIEISSERIGIGNVYTQFDKGMEYRIQAGELGFVVVEMSGRFQKLKAERVHLNETVKFALDGLKFILMCDDGKERTLLLQKRTTRAKSKTPPDEENKATAH